jgi:prolyl 4-hydroxylase
MLLYFIMHNNTYIACIVVAAVVVIVTTVLFVHNNHYNNNNNHALSSSTWTQPQVIDGFLTPEECQMVIDAAIAKGLARSRVLGKKEVSIVRTSTNTFLDRHEPASRLIFDKIHRLTGLPKSRYENVQVVRYSPDQRYDKHYDSCHKCTSDGGDLLREKTAYIYLNDDFDGGHTVFPRAGVDLQPRKGRCALWKNIERDTGKILKESEHAAQPVRRGIKWGANVWIRRDNFVE